MNQAKLVTTMNEKNKVRPKPIGWNLLLIQRRSGVEIRISLDSKNRHFEFGM
jgi:hypothetical protein